MNIAMVKCNICMREYEASQMTYFADEKLLLCAHCAPQLYTCRGCAHRADCALEKNEQNIEKLIFL